jgi:hypothetical protein
MGRIEIWPELITSEPWLAPAIVFQLERNGALFGVHRVVRFKMLDTADIVREAILRQLTLRQWWLDPVAQVQGCSLKLSIVR